MMTRSPIAEPAALARIAADEFTQRREASRRAVRAGTFPLAAAETNARIWLAIAAWAGANLPELAAPAIWPAGSTGRVSWASLADLSEIRAEAARARDTAIAKAESDPANLRTDQRARDLIALAEALGAPGIDWSGQQERKAA